jgi:hypothetical protein
MKFVGVSKNENVSSLHVSAIIGHLQVFKMLSSKETAVLCCFPFSGAAVILCTLSLFVF